jgi:hypothetical protein
MRPPICNVCGTKFTPDSDGSLVSFARDPADDAWYENAKHPGFVGHPPHKAWLCSTHETQARSLTNLTLSEAMKRLKGA